jgi:hypothetical protein
MAYWVEAIDRDEEKVDYLCLKVKFLFAESSVVQNAETLHEAHRGQEITRALANR